MFIQKRKFLKIKLQTFNYNEIEKSEKNDNKRKWAYKKTKNNWHRLKKFRGK